MNSDTKDDFEFKDSTLPKDVGNELQDNTKLFQKEHKDFGNSGSINDGDPSIPALDFKPCSSHAKVGAVKDVPGVRDYGNLGMSQLKMRILESNVEDLLPFNGENEQDSNELSAIRYDTPYRTDFDVKSNDDRTKSYATRELVEKPSVNKPNSAADLSNQLAVEQTT
ncbi:unnamed protein product [Ceratitis capitata]|uniref:(Mediterranean fruit fly) hypothetical protein n=1 Tax=Ceratitis capitata TaxID=7213 RepID=A0A811VFH9_CERCA|nr:unnamed protein product [Ceratitis capitata]